MTVSDITYPDASSCAADVEEMVHLYVDGELSFDAQPRLFEHLARCADCRLLFESVLTFRQAIRMEHLAVPPAADDAFFKRLEGHRRRHRRVDRQGDRRPLWQRRAPVSLRVAVVLVLVIFSAGLLLPSFTSDPVYVEGWQEHVDLDGSSFEEVWVLYPGLTVEADKE